MKYTILILFCLSTGWREHKDAHGWLRAAEDMTGAAPNFIFYEIVRKRNFNVFQQHTPTKWLSPFNSSHQSHTTLHPQLQLALQAFVIGESYL
jgi:hypothetical protein